MPLKRPLADSVTVITGASGGIGAATALALAARGGRIVLAARRERALGEVAEWCGDAGGVALPVPVDVADRAAVAALAHEAMERFGRIDAWVNCAAVALYAPLHEAPPDEVRRLLEVNLLGCVYGAQAAIPHLRASGGVLVNVASVLGVATTPYLGAYNVSKHAVRGLSASLRQDLRASGVTGVDVVTVLPASIDTPFYAHAANHTGRAVGPLPPVYPPEVVAKAIVGALVRPRDEVYAGQLGHALAVQWRLAPAVTERVMAMYGRTAIRDRRAPDTPGNLFEPGDEPPALTGGWHGRARMTARTAVGLALAGAGVGAAFLAALRRRG
jgi:NAD(P)-dependent dehydrogenase (short-subunit alcohol dehydrogenase family)